MLTSVLLWLFVGVPLFVYCFWLYLKYRLRKWEDYMYSKAPPISVTHDEMIEMAKKVRDQDLTDEEFDVKYGPFRHEVFRGLTMKQRTREILNDVLHYAELYFLHYGPKSLALKVSINKPIFIIGDFRSGTSVLERIIFHHPSVNAFNFGHMFMWKGPKLWDKLWDIFQQNRMKAGHPCWYGKGGKGLYSPHSSNNLLIRTNPWENEIIWSSCKQNLMINRDFNWDTLDDPEKCSDNIGSPDILTEDFSDPKFETQLKNSIRMLLAAYGGSRFINKNPLNGYRVGYLKKMFPDCKFIHIRRNPIKTCKSQVIMNETFCRVCYIDDFYWRENNMEPKPLDDPFTNKKHWSYITSKRYPNKFIGQTWIPRWWPRTYPYQLRINKYLKKKLFSCATAVGVCQHEDAAHKAFKRLKLIDNKDILYIWHEDIIEDATFCAKKIFKFLELDVSDKNILEYLEKEDFPNGQANKKRVSHSSKKNVTSFGKNGNQTNIVLKELESLLVEYNNRISIKKRYNNNNNNTNINNNINVIG